MTQVLKAAHLLGDVVLDEHGKRVLHPSKKVVPEASDEDWPKVLAVMKDQALFKEFRDKNLEATARQVRESISQDLFMIQAVSAIEEIDRAANLLGKRIREWAGWWVPEAVSLVQDHAALARLVESGTQESLLSQAHVSKQDSMGAPLNPRDAAALKAQASTVSLLQDARDRHEAYLKAVMTNACPNLCAVAGHMIGAQLIQHAGSLRRLAEMPSSTVQLLGAEKALFRHLRTGAKPPKYGVIFQHQLIQSAGRPMQGKMARALADKISIAVRVDYFKGSFVGDKLRQELEKRAGA